MLRAAFAPPVGEQAAACWVRLPGGVAPAGWRPSEADLRALRVPALSAGRRAALLCVAAEGLRDRQARMAGYEPLLTGGDPGRGRAVLRQGGRVGAACHRVGGEGGRVGPDLTRIGAIRSGRDLLELILCSSLDLRPGLRALHRPRPPTAGSSPAWIARQDADMLILRDSSGAETRLRRDEVAVLRRSEASLMPEGLGNAS